MSRKRRRAARALEGRVRDLAHGGEAAVQTDEGIVLALGALPGERVRLAQVRRRGRALRGRVAEVLEPSADRVEPACAHVASCGGCPLMPLELEAQRQHKARLVARALGLQEPVPLTAAGEALGYRRRARLAWSTGRSGSARLGYRRRGSDRLVAVEACPVLRPPLATALERVRQRLLPHLRGEGELRLALGAGESAVVRLRSDDAQPPELYGEAEALAADPDVAGVALRVGGASADARFGEPYERVPGIDGAPLEGPLESFSQANDAVSHELVREAVGLAAPAGARVLELYAGIGNFTVALAAEAASLTAVEADPEAAEACRRNLAARGLAGRVVCAEAEAGADGDRVDVVLLDPPRTGARGALAAIDARRPQRIVYVSCDPATLARDVGELGSAGWAPTAARAFDMFPQTAHVEVVLRLEKGPDVG